MCKVCRGAGYKAKTTKFTVLLLDFGMMIYSNNVWAYGKVYYYTDNINNAERRSSPKNEYSTQGTERGINVKVNEGSEGPRSL